MRHPSGRDLLWAAALLGLVAAFFLPLLTERESFFFDDIAFYYYPQQRFLSRSLAAGEIAWWDPHTCAGAKPFYANLFQCSLYPPQWPFQALGRLFPERDYLWLVKAPLLIHYLLSALGGFALARAGLGLGRLGSALFAVSYTLSPSLLYMATDPPEVFVQSYLPLYLLCAIRYSRRGRRLWLALGAAAFALGSAGGDVPFVFHTVFIAGLFLAGLSLLAFLRREGGVARRLLVGGAFLFTGGFLLSGIYWSNMAEGLLLLRGRAGAELTGRGQSLPPLYLITLLIPDFFGGVTSLHSWGAGHAIDCTLNDVNLSGGAAGILVILLGLAGAVPGGRPLPSGFSRRGLGAVFFSLFLLSLAVILGVYTPLYRPLGFVVPLFRMPYPVRFRIIECFAFAGLLGLGADGLAAGLPLRRRWIIAALGAALLLALGLGLFLSYPAERGGILAGHRLLAETGEWAWFIRGPLAYAAAVLILLIASAVHLPPALLPRGLVLFSLLEIVFFAYPAFYRNVVLNRRIRDVSGVRFANPREHPVYRLLDYWPASPEEREGFRRVCYRSSFDNLSWVDGGLSLLGFDTKPLLPEFESAVNAVAPGVPYELWPRDWGSRFWANFSVRCLLRPPACPSAFPAPADLQSRADALPRFYFQDRWKRVSGEEEQAAILFSDLGRQGVVAETEADGLPAEFFAPPSASGFADLQGENVIVSREVSSPNRLRFGVRAGHPALLVVTDAWHPDWRTTLDGRAERTRRVNGFQRGVFCPPGDHLVEMAFAPRPLRRGCALTAAGLAALGAAAFLGRRPRTGSGRVRISTPTETP